MADNTYPLGGQGNRQEQGGKSWVIGSTGSLTVESGGRIVQEGTISFSTNYVLVGSTAGSTITNYGVSILTRATTGLGALTWTLAAPSPGVRKTIVVTTANVTDTVKVDANNSPFNGYGTQDILIFIETGAVELIGLTTASWGIVSSVPETTGTPVVATTS